MMRCGIATFFGVIAVGFGFMSVIYGGRAIRSLHKAHRARLLLVRACNNVVQQILRDGEIVSPRLTEALTHMDEALGPDFDV